MFIFLLSPAVLMCFIYIIIIALILTLGLTSFISLPILLNFSYVTHLVVALIILLIIYQAKYIDKWKAKKILMFIILSFIVANKVISLH